MSKLFKLKEWLTLEEAAKHLSITLGEEVAIADIYRLALDGHLVLSVYLPNGAEATLGDVVGWDEATRLPADILHFMQDLLGKGKDSENLTDKKPQEIIISPYIGNDQFINWHDKVISIDGVWDLPMLAGEMLEVEHEFLQLRGGPALELSNIEGFFLKKGEGVARLMESTEENPYIAGSMAAKRTLEMKIALSTKSEEAIQKIWEEFAEERDKFLQERKSKRSSENYYPADGMPKDGIYIVRTAALVEFLNKINEKPVSDKPLSTKERHSMLTLIAALCKEADYDLNKRGIATSLAKATEELGKPLTDDTIRKILAQAKELLS